jgi:hypothetical protein
MDSIAQRTYGSARRPRNGWRQGVSVGSSGCTTSLSTSCSATSLLTSCPSPPRQPREHQGVGGRLPRPKVAAQGTSTGPTATCGVSISSSSCATSLLTSCQVREDGGEGKFDNESPEGKTGEQGMQPGMQGPAGVMKEVRRGNNDQEINLVSLSFGSDTEYLVKRYVIVDSEVEQNGSLALGSLL